MTRAAHIAQHLLEMDVHSAKDIIGQLTPTDKTVKLGGNDMLNAPGMVRLAIREAGLGAKGRKWARQLMGAWQLLPATVDQILSDPRTVVEGNGKSAIVTIHTYAQPARNRQSSQRPPAEQ